MKSTTRLSSAFRVVLAGVTGFALLSAVVVAQDRLKTMPGYEQYQRMSKEIPGAVKLGTLTVTWKDGGKALEYPKDGKTWRYDVATKATTEVAAGRRRPAPASQAAADAAASAAVPGAAGRRRRPSRPTRR